MWGRLLFGLALEQKLFFQRQKRKTNNNPLYKVKVPKQERSSTNTKSRRSRDENQGWQWRILGFRALSRKDQTSYCLGTGKIQIVVNCLEYLTCSYRLGRRYLGHTGCLDCFKSSLCQSHLSASCVFQSLDLTGAHKEVYIYGSKQNIEK